MYNTPAAALNHLCDLTHFCVWRDSLVYVCDMDHSYVWWVYQNSITCMKWLIPACSLHKSSCTRVATIPLVIRAVKGGNPPKNTLSLPFFCRKRALKLESNSRKVTCNFDNRMGLGCPAAGRKKNWFFLFCLCNKYVGPQITRGVLLLSVAQEQQLLNTVGKAHYHAQREESM